MPRPNPLRGLHSETNLARRVAYERERRGWSYESTAKRMSAVGCPVQGSAVYRIEKGVPRRRISVDELVAFSRVFEVDIDELLVPMAFFISQEVKTVAERTVQSRIGTLNAVVEMAAAVAALMNLAVAAEEGLKGDADSQQIFTMIGEALDLNKDTLLPEGDLENAVASAFLSIWEAVVVRYRGEGGEGALDG